MPYEDPLAWIKVPGLEEAVTPLLSDYLGYHKLPVHLEELLLSAAFYQAVYYVSAFVSPKVCKGYNALSKRTQVNFDIHVVSQVQAILILVLSFPLFFDKTLDADHIYGYTPYSGLVAALATGYFFWDIYICIKYFKMFGLGFAIHGIGAGFVFLQTLRPTSNNYLPHFLLFEISTPFLNVNWFASHLPEGTIPFSVQKINGVFLLASFFFARIVWGFLQAGRVFNDMFLGGQDYVRLHPLWVDIGSLSSNMALNFLNVYWFYKMLRLAKRALASGSGSAAKTAKAKKAE